MNKVFKSIVLLLCSSLPALAQDGRNIGAGAYVDRAAIVREDEGRVVVTVDINLSDVSPRTDAAVVFTPVLRSADGRDSLLLGDISVLGHSKWLYARRNGFPAGDVLHAGHVGGSGVWTYKAEVPYEQWMDSAGLYIGIDSRHCCKTPVQLSNGLVATAAFVKPRPEVVFTPQYAYITPETEKVKARDVSGSARISFPVGKSEVLPDFRDNALELMSIRRTIDAVAGDADATITGISLKGFASPEGAYASNERLAAGRVASLKSYLLQTYGSLTSGNIETSYEAEDWAGLREFVAASELGGRVGILSVIDSDFDPDAKERRISLSWPSDWKSLKDNCFPLLRRTDYTVSYEVRSYNLEETAEKLHSAAKNLSLQEMFNLAATYPEGSPEFNDVFIVAVHTFAENPVANLNAACVSLRLGETGRAAMYLENAGDSPEAENARGILAWMNGDYDAASKHFASAAAADLPAGAANSSALEEYLDYISSIAE